MKIIVVGATGTIGREVVKALSAKGHEVVAASRSAKARVDIRDSASIEQLFATTKEVDAVVSCAGDAAFKPLVDLTDGDFETSLRSKLMGQVNLALIGCAHLVDGGSITLISGILAEQPIRTGSSASMVNGAIEAFVRAAAIELPRGIRINAVSPNVFIESWPEYGPYFNGFEPVPVARAALAFVRSIDGGQSGQVYKVW